MEEAKDLVLDLSQEELLYLLSLFNTPLIPGLDPAILQGASEREIAIAVDVAARALIARGLVIPKENGKVDLNEVVVALVGTCAFPSFSVVLDLVTPLMRQSVFWHGTQNLIIEHSQPMPAIHKFRALAKDSDLVAQIVAWLGELPSNDSKEGSQKISSVTYETSRKLVLDEQKNSEALQILQGEGLTERVGEGIIKAFSEGKVSAKIAFMRHARPDQPSVIDGASFIITSSNIFLITPFEGSSQLEIKEVTVNDLLSWVKIRLDAILESQSTPS